MQSRRLAGGLAAAVLAAALAGCATVPAKRPPPARAARTAPLSPSPSQPAPPVVAAAPVAPPAALTPPVPPSPFAALQGWAADDHLQAFHAFLAGCPAMHEPAAARLCRRAAAAPPADEAAARAFLEANFRPVPVAEAGLLTAYYTPVYEARADRAWPFTAPVRPRPADLPRTASTSEQVYPDRAQIEARPAHGALAWMRPEDLFFLQIQGSGVLSFPEGPPMRAVFDGSNGAPFLGLAAPMRSQGLLSDGDSSAQRIHDWLAANRGPRAEALMRLDRRYVFFRLQADDGAEPAGSAGVRLPPGRALAVDAARHAMGEVLWVDADAPSLPGAFPAYRRLALALDTGGAIKGGTRADLYLGRGPDAGAEAGRVRHVLHLYRLAPLDTPAS